jgi:MFS family permease
MIYSTLLWHFWMSRVMLGIVGTGFALGSALLTDISEPEELDTALSRFATTPWIGGVVGYALTGIAMEQVGMISTLWLGLFTALVAALLIFSIRLKSVTKIQV